MAVASALALCEFFLSKEIVWYGHAPPPFSPTPPPPSLFPALVGRVDECGVVKGSRVALFAAVL